MWAQSWILLCLIPDVAKALYMESCLDNRTLNDLAPSVRTSAEQLATFFETHQPPQGFPFLLPEDRKIQLLSLLYERLYSIIDAVIQQVEASYTTPSIDHQGPASQIPSTSVRFLSCLFEVGFLPRAERYRGKGPTTYARDFASCHSWESSNVVLRQLSVRFHHLRLMVEALFDLLLDAPQSRVSIKGTGLVPFKIIVVKSWPLCRIASGINFAILEASINALSSETFQRLEQELNGAIEGVGPAFSDLHACAHFPGGFLLSALVSELSFAQFRPGFTFVPVSEMAPLAQGQPLTSAEQQWRLFAPLSNRLAATLMIQMLHLRLSIPQVYVDGAKSLEPLSSSPESSLVDAFGYTLEARAEHLDKVRTSIVQGLWPILGHHSQSSGDFAELLRAIKQTPCRGITTRDFDGFLYHVWWRLGIYDHAATISEATQRLLTESWIAAVDIFRAVNSALSVALNNPNAEQRDELLLYLLITHQQSVIYEVLPRIRAIVFALEGAIRIPEGYEYDWGESLIVTRAQSSWSAPRIKRAIGGEMTVPIPNEDNAVAKAQGDPRFRTTSN